MNDLQVLLGSGWAWVGVGRDNGRRIGEYNPIFYKKWVKSIIPPGTSEVMERAVIFRSIFKLIHSDTFWLTYVQFLASY